MLPIKDIIVIAVKTVDLEIPNFKLQKLLIENNLSLDDISPEITSIVNSDFRSLVVYQSLLYDVLELAELKGIDYNIMDLNNDLAQLSLNINHRLKQFIVPNKELKAIYFKGFDSMFFVYK